MYTDRPPIETRDRYGATPIEFREEVPGEKFCFRKSTDDAWAYCGSASESGLMMVFSPVSIGTYNTAHTTLIHNLAVTEQEFSKLAARWKAETSFHSSLSKKFTHPDYQTIMAMGKDALPFILRSLATEPDHWFYALKFIARKDIGEGAISFAEARLKWLEWGKANDYL